MGIRERLARRLFGGEIKRAAIDIVQKNLSGKFGKWSESNPIMDGSEDPDRNQPDFQHYRPLTASKRDIPEFKHQRAMEIAFHLWLSTPLGRRLIQLGRDHVIADGVQFQSKNKKNQAVLDKLWTDSVNNFPVFQYQIAEQIAIFGDQCYPVNVNPETGHVRLGYVDPTNVEGIIIDPANGKRVMGVRVKAGIEMGEATLKVISVDEDPANATFGYRTGDCFYFRINHVTNQRRGVSDLFSVADYVDGRDRLLFQRIDLNSLQRAFIWDVLLKGANESDLSKWREENGPPRQGTVRVHNENEEWNAVSPKLESSDAKTDLDALKGDILSAFGYPWHWFGEGGDVNRATALEMGSPTYKSLKARQAMIRAIFEEIGEFALDQALIHGMINAADRADGFDVAMSEMATRDLERAATTIVNVASGLQLGEQADWISRESAAKVFLHAVAMTGIQLDPADEAKKIQAEGLEGAGGTEADKVLTKGVGDIIEAELARIRQSGGAANAA